MTLEYDAVELDEIRPCPDALVAKTTCRHGHVAHCTRCGQGCDLDGHANIAICRRVAVDAQLGRAPLFTHNGHPANKGPTP